MDNTLYQIVDDLKGLERGFENLAKEHKQLADGYETLKAEFDEYKEAHPPTEAELQAEEEKRKQAEAQAGIRDGEHVIHVDDPSQIQVLGVEPVDGPPPPDVAAVIADSTTGNRRTPWDWEK